MAWQKVIAMQDRVCVTGHKEGNQSNRMNRTAKTIIQENSPEIKPTRNSVLKEHTASLGKSPLRGQCWNVFW